jgi:hypothetical protein
MVERAKKMGIPPPPTEPRKLPCRRPREPQESGASCTLGALGGTTETSKLRCTAVDTTVWRGAPSLLNDEMKLSADDFTCDVVGDVGDEALLAAYHAHTATTALCVTSRTA